MITVERHNDSILDIVLCGMIIIYRGGVDDALDFYLRNKEKPMLDIKLEHTKKEMMSFNSEKLNYIFE